MNFFFLLFLPPTLVVKVSKTAPRQWKESGHQTNTELCVGSPIIVQITVLGNLGFLVYKIVDCWSKGISSVRGVVGLSRGRQWELRPCWPHVEGLGSQERDV